ncbi:f-box only protein 43-like protein, partial [Corchorus olitorius]
LAAQQAGLAGLPQQPPAQRCAGASAQHRQPGHRSAPVAVRLAGQRCWLPSGGLRSPAAWARPGHGSRTSRRRGIAAQRQYRCGLRATASRPEPARGAETP